MAFCKHYISTVKDKDRKRMTVDIDRSRHAICLQTKQALKFISEAKVQISVSVRGKLHCPAVTDTNLSFFAFSSTPESLWFRKELAIHHPVHRGHIPPNYLGDSMCLLETFQV